MQILIIGRHWQYATDLAFLVSNHFKSERDLQSRQDRDILFDELGGKWTIQLPLIGFDYLKINQSLPQQK